MSHGLSVLLFFLLTVAWVALAFLPGLIELRRRSDVSPLTVVPESEVDIRYFARRFGELLAREMGELMAQCRADGRIREGAYANGAGYMVLPLAETPKLRAFELKDASTERLVFGADYLSLPAGYAFLGEVYSTGNCTVGERCILRAVLSEKDLILGAETSCLRWLHAEGKVLAGGDCSLMGRASSQVLIRLAPDCCFERLSAPRIEFGSIAAPAPAAAADLTRVVPRELPRVVEYKAGRCLVLGDLHLPPASLFEVDLVVQGRVTIGDGSRLLGSLKSAKDLTLGAGVQIEGAAISGRNFAMGEGSSVAGPLLVEKEARIAGHCRIGREERPTTLSAGRAWIGLGTVAHGSVWAHQGGCVAPEAAAPRAAHA